MLNTVARDTQCPVCAATLAATGATYQVDELFDLWKPVTFSPETIEEHRRLALATELFCCPQCALEIFLPRIIGTPAFYVEAYNLTGSQAVSEFTYADDKWEFGQAAADASGCRRVFEFGCGNGNFLSRLRQEVPEVAGLEYNPAAVDTARAKGLKVFARADTPAEYGRNWDAAFSFHVLEHVADPVAFVRQMADTVKPGGLVGITVPNQDGPIRYIDPCIMNMPPHHATRWHLPTFEALARRLGLTIRRVAREPLLLENHGYYSVHWVRHALPGQSWFITMTRFVLSVSMRLFFGGLYRLGLRYFPLLKGQSIYLLMTTPQTQGTEQPCTASSN